MSTNDLSLRDITIVYGAVLSTAALIWNVIRDLDDRPKLKVEAMIGRSFPSVDNKQRVFLTVTNIGKRPVMVKGWYGILKDSNFMVVTTQLPKMLEESQYLTEKLDDLTVFESGLKSFYITDSSDKGWKISAKNVKRLYKDYSELKKKGQL